MLFYEHVSKIFTLDIEHIRVSRMLYAYKYIFNETYITIEAVGLRN